MSDESDGNRLRITRDQLIELLGAGGGRDSSETDDLGDMNTRNQVRVPFSVADHIYIIHDGVEYEIVEREDGLDVEVRDE